MLLVLWCSPGGVRVLGQFYPCGEQSWSLIWSVVGKTSICHLNWIITVNFWRRLWQWKTVLCIVRSIYFWHNVFSSVYYSLPPCMFCFSLVAQKIVATRKKQQLSIGPCKSLPNSPSHSSVCSAQVSAVHISQVQTIMSACLKKEPIGCFSSNIFNVSALFAAW